MKICSVIRARGVLYNWCSTWAHAASQCVGQPRKEKRTRTARDASCLIARAPLPGRHLHQSSYSWHHGTSCSKIQRMSTQSCLPFPKRKRIKPSANQFAGWWWWSYFYFWKKNEHDWKFEIVSDPRSLELCEFQKLRNRCPSSFPARASLPLGIHVGACDLWRERIEALRQGANLIIGGGLMKSRAGTCEALPTAATDDHAGQSSCSPEPASSH